MPPAPYWQVGLAIVLCTLTSLRCVGTAAQIFGAGLLMQGKSPSFGELARWVVAR